MAGMTRKAGRKGTRKAGKGKTMRGGKRPMSPWIKKVMAVYAEMKKKHGKKASFSDAMKEAKKRK